MKKLRELINYNRYSTINCIKIFFQSRCDCLFIPIPK